MTRIKWTFDATPHLYRLDRQVVPSVTDIVDDVPIGYGERASERGTAIHHALLALDLGAYHPDDYPPFVEPHMIVYREFLATYRPKWTRLEQAKVHRAGFGGTADRLGRVQQLDAVVEFKSGATAPWHAWQTAGYDLLHDDLPPRVRARYVLYLSPTRFRFIEHRFRSDYAEFLQRARQMGVKL